MSSSSESQIATEKVDQKKLAYVDDEDAQVNNSWVVHRLEQLFSCRKTERPCSSDCVGLCGLGGWLFWARKGTGLFFEQHMKEHVA